MKPWTRLITGNNQSSLQLKKYVSKYVRICIALCLAGVKVIYSSREENMVSHGKHIIMEQRGHSRNIYM